MSETN